MKTTLPDLLALAKLTAPICREIAVKPRVMNEADGTVEFVASDETLDKRYREIIRVGGWKFDLFAKNAPFRRFRTIIPRSPSCSGRWWIGAWTSKAARRDSAIRPAAGHAGGVGV